MHPDKRTPSTPDIQPHTRMFLGSDFVSPAEVLAAGHLSDQQKREILDVWRQSLAEKPELAETRVLLAAVEVALDSLPKGHAE